MANTHLDLDSDIVEFIIYIVCMFIFHKRSLVNLLKIKCVIAMPIINWIDYCHNIVAKQIIVQ